METQKFVQPQDVRSRLAELGLTEQVLWDAVRRSELAFRNSTANHPPLYAGFVSWAEAVRGLREVLVPSGWRKCDDFNYSVCVNQTGDVAIAVATGDEGTGDPEAIPSTKSPKGPSTQDAIAWNNVLYPDLFEGTPHAITVSRPADPESKRITWLLLIHRSHGKVRCELSLPLSISDDGRPNGWKERIILGSFDGDPELIDVSTPELPSITLDIKRKA